MFGRGLISGVPVNDSSVSRKHFRIDIQDDLRQQGCEFSWRRVAKIMDELGLPRVKNGRK